MSRAQRASDAIGAILAAVYEWEDDVDSFFVTGGEDDDVCVAHDATGALIECVPRRGLQQELTLRELEDAVNAALRANAARVQEGLAQIMSRFGERCQVATAGLGGHPVGADMVAALSGSRR